MGILTVSMYMFESLLSRFSKDLLPNTAADVEKAQTDLKWTEQIDPIQKFYIFFKQKLLQKLEGLDFDPVLPESSQKVINSDQTVEGLKKSDLSQFPTKYYGIVLFKKTLEELEHRITHLSKVKAGNVKEMVEAHEEAVAALNVPDLLVHYKLPSQIINGYWFYDDLAKYVNRPVTETRTIIFIPPNAVDNLKKLPIKGTFKCEADFKIDPDISFAIRAVKDMVDEIDGFVCLEEIVSADAPGYTKDPDMLLTCEHGFSEPDSWLCSACLGNVTGYKHDASSNNHVCCENCGIGDWLTACFCKSDQLKIDKLTEELEGLKNLVKKMESQFASMKMAEEFSIVSVQGVV